MLALAGQTLLLGTLAAALIGIIAAIRGNGQFVRQAAAAALASAIGASLILVVALVTSDFSIAYVAGHSASTLAPGFRISAWWGGQEGSLVLWLLVLATYTWLVARGAGATGSSGTASVAAVRRVAGGVLLAMVAAFTALVAIVTPVFARSAETPVDGTGLAIALQNYWMAIHPPVLYLGYVAAAVPFAITAGGLLTQAPATRWLPLARRWALVSWVGLTAGLFLGARWAYTEIGWGGYWAWDPVENAALMPWLVATAYIHGLHLQSRRGTLAAWNVLLAGSLAALSIFGTFVTRSGLLQSVHAFVESSVGPWFLGVLGIVSMCAAGLVVMALRSAPEPRNTPHGPRGVAYLANATLLGALTVAVLWGVLQPIATEAFTGVARAATISWYNGATLAAVIPLLVAMTVGQSLPWGRASNLRRLMAPASAAAATLVLLAATGNIGAPAAAVAVAFGMAVTVGAGIRLWDLYRRARNGRGRLRTELGVRRRRIGGYVAHVGVGLLVVSATASSAWQTHHTAELRTGETTTVAGYSLEYREAERTAAGTDMRVNGRFAVSRGGTDLGEIVAGRTFHTVQGEVTANVAVVHDRLRATDLMVVVDTLDERGGATVQVYANPMVDILWLSGVLLTLGGLVAGWPSRPAHTGDGTDRAQRGIQQSWSAPSATPASTKPPRSGASSVG